MCTNNLTTNTAVARDVNNLAAQLYKMRGHAVPSGFKFYNSSDPEAELCWNAASVAYCHRMCETLDDTVKEDRVLAA